MPPGLDPAMLRDQLFDLWNRKDLQMVRVTFTACVRSIYAILSVCVCVYKGSRMELLCVCMKHLHRKEQMRENPESLNEAHLCVCVLMRKPDCLSVGRNLLL